MCNTFKHSPWLYFYFSCLLLYQIWLSDWTELNWIHILPYHQWHFHLTEVNIFSCSEWLALPISILFLRACVLSYVLLSATLWTIACQDPLFMQFSKKGYWSICHFLLQGIFPTQGSNLSLLCLLHWQAGVFFSTESLGKPRCQWDWSKPWCLFPLSRGVGYSKGEDCWQFQWKLWVSQD